MKTLFLLHSFMFIFPIALMAQSPCGTNFMGYDPCSAEPLSTASNCTDAQEVFQTNDCFGSPPASSTCGQTVQANLVWGSFTVVNPDTYTITWTASNNSDIQLGLYQFTDPCTMGGETEIGCVDAGGDGADETISEFLNAGTYYVCATSSVDLSSSSTICVHAPSVPPPVVASDCAIGVNVCTNLSFMIDPNGEGSNTTEIANPGDPGNPLYDGFSTFNPWGTSNMGCLQIGESNSTWMYVNISGSGDLEFTFGGNGTQGGYYDWSMYPATADCDDIASHTVDPIRCNWNLVDYGGTGLADTPPTGGDVGNFEPALPVLAGEVYIICFSNYSSVQTAVPLEFGGTAEVSCNPILLPVEMVSFSAVALSRYVDVEWETNVELNADYYSIERSIGEANYQKIGTIQAIGTSSDNQSYHFRDLDPIEGEVNYYRIKQVDQNGEVKYSEVRAVAMPKKLQVGIHPNPATDEVIIDLEEVHNNQVKVEIRDVLGSPIHCIVWSEDEKSLKFSVSDFDPGAYFVQIWKGNRLIESEYLIVR